MEKIRILDKHPGSTTLCKKWQKLFNLKKTIMKVGRVLTCKRQARQRNMRKGFPWPNCVGGGRRLKHAKIRLKLYTRERGAD